MKLLITGGTGQLGSEFAALHRKDIVCLSRQDCDITNPLSLEKAIAEHQPSIIINTAAYTAVDKSETESEQAYLINRDGVLNLARACKQSQIPLIHFSTDYVFDGEKSSAYTEEDHPNPRNIYGKSKWEGECVLRKNWEQHLIIRVSWIFGQYGHNFPKSILRLAKEREELKIVADQKGCPTSTRSIVQMVLKVCEQLQAGHTPWGTFHYSNQPATNWFEFTEAILAEARIKETLLVKEVHPITTAQYPMIAKRPENSVLNIHKIQNAFDIISTQWEHELKLIV